MRSTTRDLMHAGVLTCTLTTPLQDAARTMAEHEISALVVVDEHDVVVGILSRTDVVNARLYAQYWKHWRGLTAGQVMTKDVVTVGLDEPVEQAGRIMVERKIRRIVVVEPGEYGPRPIGILSLTDIVREIAGESIDEPGESS